MIFFLILCSILGSNEPVPLFEKLPLATRFSRHVEEVTAHGIESVCNKSLKEVDELVQNIQPGEPLCLFYFPKESEHWKLCDAPDAMPRLTYIKGIEKLGCSKVEITFLRNLAFYPDKEALREEIQNEPLLWKTASIAADEGELVISYKVLRIILWK